MANPFAPIYLKLAEVKTYLGNKVKCKENDDNAISDETLSDIISQAESQVERDLGMMYATPFVTNDPTPLAWTSLPRQTYSYLRNMFLVQAQIIIMLQYFGKSDNVQGEQYIENLQVQYDRSKRQITAVKQNGVMLYPPLDKLALANTGILYNNVVPMPIIGKRAQKSNILKYAINHVPNPNRSPYFPLDSNNEDN